MKKLKVINLFAGPGAGKSTTAAGVFHRLKVEGINCELVTEYAKDRVWEKHFSAFDDSLYLLAKQFHKIFRLSGQVEYAINDSPLIMTLYYNQRGVLGKGKLKEKIDSLSEELFDMFDNYNFFIARKKEYNPKGRLQSETEARKIDKELKKILDTKKIKYFELQGDCLQSVDEIVEFILNGEK